jgi:hypothetical protein
MTEGRQRGRWKKSEGPPHALFRRRANRLGSWSTQLAACGGVHKGSACPISLTAPLQI